MPSLRVLVERLGVPLRDERLLVAALTHSSFSNEHPEAGDLESSERLEFLGDSVLSYLASGLVFARYPGRGEGDLSELRALLVRTSTLADYARDLGLGAFLRVSRGEERSGARQREGLLADTFESVVAAIFLDAGLDAVRQVVLPRFERRLEGVNLDALRVDYRSVLQERVQASRGITPRYTTLAEAGPDHRREYTVAVSIGEQRVGVGQGGSKQAAAQEAAREALALLDGPEGAVWG